MSFQIHFAKVPLSVTERRGHRRTLMLVREINLTKHPE